MNAHPSIGQGNISSCEFLNAEGSDDMEKQLPWGKKIDGSNDSENIDVLQDGICGSNLPPRSEIYSCWGSALHLLCWPVTLFSRDSYLKCNHFKSSTNTSF